MSQVLHYDNLALHGISGSLNKEPHYQLCTSHIANSTLDQHSVDIEHSYNMITTSLAVMTATAYNS